MRSSTISRARLIALAALGAFATLVPTASADTEYPVWTCRASAAYVEVNPLIAGQRVEPVLANGLPNRDTPDREACSNQDTGLQRIELPPGSGAAALLTLEAASASTRLTPAIAPARDQAVTADAGIEDTLRVNVPGLVITAETITSRATGDCNGTTPVLDGESTILNLTINGIPIVVLGQELNVDLLPLIRIALHEEEVNPVAATATTPAEAS